ncbi:ABC transporter ATP-binding protein [Calycomorphotria hydatis]|nr:ABC transporter ATP-binding protein [Calycomorphotria hydatis]
MDEFMVKQQPPIVGNFARVWPYVWKYRRSAILSCVIALFVAIFWGLNLSLTFPVVKVLLEGENLQDYVSHEISVAEKEVSDQTRHLADVEERLAELETDNLLQSEEHVALLTQQSKIQRRMTANGRQLLIMNWLNTYIVRRLPQDHFDLLAVILGLLLFATVLKGLCVFVQDVLVGSVVERTIMDLRKAAFRRTLSMDYQTLSFHGTPVLMARFTNDMTQLSYGLQLVGGKVVREPLKALACVTGAMCVSWRLTLLSLVFAPLAAFIFYKIGKKMKTASHRMMESMSAIYKTLEETFDAIKVVIAFNGAATHRRQFHRQNKEYYSKAMRIVTIDSLTSPTTETLGLVAAFGALLPGAYLVLRQADSIWGIKLSAGQLDIAELSMLYGFLAGMIDPMRKLSSVYGKLKRSTAAADRVFSLIDQRPLVRDSSKAQPISAVKKSIEFQNVEFRYMTASDETETDRRPILNDISFTVNAGDVVAVVGENGCGKSTLLNLLPRFFDPTHGAVLIDGINLRDLRVRDLRDQIAVVTQETHLFDTTVEENIRYGRTSATKAEIEAAAKQAHVTEFLSDLPNGMQTNVGEKGRRLSGGQRQRISLARAMLRNPSILILDEATSAVDANSEKLIQEALAEFAKGRTVFLITHKVTRTLLDFIDRVAVMQDGRLVSYGPHAETYAVCPIYRKLYRTQTGQPNGDEPTDFDPESIDQFESHEVPDGEEIRTVEHDTHEPHILKLPGRRRSSGTETA